MSLEDITNQLNATTLTGGYEGLIEALKNVDPPILNPTKSLLKKLASLMDSKKCLCCNAVFDSEQQLVAHILEDDHKITQKIIAKRKRALLHRIHESHPEETSSFQLQEKDVGSLLNRSEKAAYSSLFRNPIEQGESNIVNYLSPGELATLHNIIYDELFLINLSGRRNRRRRSSRETQVAPVVVAAK